MNYPPFLAWIAVVPLIVIFYTGYVRVWVWIQVIPLTCAVTAAIAFLFWQVPLLTILASIFQGITISLQHIFFLISVALFTEVLRTTHSLDPLQTFFQRFSPDRRIQAIAVAWFFASFLEGLMGFAFSGSMVAVVLIGMGFPPACAILLGIMGPITASAFSCAGTPILFHAMHGLQDSSLALQLSNSGSHLDAYLHSVTSYVGVINGIVGTLMPLGMIVMMTRFYGKNRSWKEAFDIAPFALFCGLAFTLPYALTAITLGPQFPSIFGSIVGLALFLIAHRTRFLLPRRTWNFEPFSHWEPAWYEGHYEKPTSPKRMSWRLAWMPLVVLLFLFLFLEYPHSPLKKILQSYTLQKNNFMGTPIALFAQPLLMPHTLLIVFTSIITLAAHKFKNIERIFNQRLSIFVSKAFLSLPLIMCITAIYLNSGFNKSGYPAMHAVIAEQMTALPIPRILHFVISPFLAAAITDVSSSGMYSIMLMSAFQHHLGFNLIGNGAFFVAIQITASTAANMFAGHYLNGITLHAGKEGLTGPMGRLALRPLFVYLILTGIIAWIISIVFYRVS
ncbi:MAG: L-lactate permease [Verrucomicrobiota bacterium]